MPHPVTRRIRGALREQADPVRAAGMARYMRGIQAFAGVQGPAVYKIADAAAQSAAPSLGELETIVRELFAGRWREEFYAAFRLAQRWRAWRWAAALPLFEWMIAQAQWWDVVDAVATRLISPMLLEHPRLRKRVFGYIDSPDFWFRRTALLAQLKFKGETDPRVLEMLIGKAAGDPGILHPQGDRLGATGIRAGEPGLGAGLGAAQRGAALPAQPQGSAQAPRLAVCLAGGNWACMLPCKKARNASGDWAMPACFPSRESSGPSTT